jgi:hypothetical protein
MNRLLSYLTILALTAPLAGCLVATRPGPRTTVVERCGPAHHWEDGECRHNGRGHDDDHDRGHGHGHGHD